jgi:uncharacterized protein
MTGMDENLTASVDDARDLAGALEMQVHAEAESLVGLTFGLHLLVATQRPLKVHEHLLSPCDNLVLMRMNSTRDVARVAELSHSRRPACALGRHPLAWGKRSSVAASPRTPMVVTTSGRIAQEGGADVPTAWARAEPVGPEVQCL